MEPAAPAQSEHTLTREEGQLVLGMRVVGVAMQFAGLFLFNNIPWLRDAYAWYPRQTDYELMLVLFFAACGWMLIGGSCNLHGAAWFLNFLIFGFCYAHALLMTYQVLQDPVTEVMHMYPHSDIFFLLYVGTFFLVLKVRAERSRCAVSNNSAADREEKTLWTHNFQSDTAAGYDRNEQVLCYFMRLLGVVYQLFFLFLFNPIPIIRDAYAWYARQFEYEMMLLCVAAAQGWAFFGGSYNLRRANWVLNFAIFGFGYAHSLLMVGLWYADMKREATHMYPHADITLLSVIATVFWALKFNCKRLFKYGGLVAKSVEEVREYERQNGYEAVLKP